MPTRAPRIQRTYGPSEFMICPMAPRWHAGEMQMRSFGQFGEVSALTLGGGGIGNCFGAVGRAEGVGTGGAALGGAEALSLVRAALDAGITMIDVAPGYGDGEAETVVGEALGGVLRDELLITTKVGLPDAEGATIRDTITRGGR